MSSLESGRLVLPCSLGGLRVVLVHDWLTGRRGGEKCLEVLGRAFPEAPLFTLLYRAGSVGPVIEGRAIHTSPLQWVPGIERRYRWLLPLMPGAAACWRVGRPDLVVSLSHCVAKAVRVPAGVPHVCYCFTPMRYAWDGRDSYLEGWGDRPIRRWLVGGVLDRLRAWDRRTAAGVSHFVAISRTVQERIGRCYGRESEIIEPPVDTEFYTPAEVVREPYYLVVSALVPYKRVDQAIEACCAAGRRLVVIGEGPERSELERQAGPGVTFLGWQPDEVIREHMRRCRALLFPGVEDFGIVPMEALACGAPVLALAVGGVAETVDNRVGRLHHEATAEGLRRSLLSWEADGCPHDPREARRRAERFAVRRFEQRLLGYLAGVVEGRVPPSGWLGADGSRVRFDRVGSGIRRRRGVGSTLGSGRRPD